MTFTTLRRYSRTEQIVEEIRKAIDDGTFKTGDRLPPERELANAFGVSRTSIREAVKILGTYGLIRSVQGDGLYVTDQFSENVLGFLGHDRFVTGDNYRSLHQARLIMETGCLMASLDGIGADDIDRLERIVENQANEDCVENLHRLDAEFHITLIKTSQNPIMVSLYEMIHKIMVNGAQEGVSLFPAAKRKVVAEHKKIVSAIKSGSRTRCYNSVAEHLNTAVEMFAKIFERNA